MFEKKWVFSFGARWTYTSEYVDESTDVEDSLFHLSLLCRQTNKACTEIILIFTKILYYRITTINTLYSFLQRINRNRNTVPFEPANRTEAQVTITHYQ